MTTRIFLYGVASSALLAGCTNSLDRVRDTVANAPDWYDARAAEVRGEGYPSISRIPELAASERATTGLESARTEISDAEALFRMDPRSVPPGLELDRMLAWAQDVQSAFEAEAAAEADHLTEEEVRRLRSLFDRPRARS